MIERWYSEKNEKKKYMKIKTKEIQKIFQIDEKNKGSKPEGFKHLDKNLIKYSNFNPALIITGI